jgi:hypothetical protein
MRSLDYQEAAELYLGSDLAAAISQGPRSFGTAAKALRFAFEEAAPVSLRGAVLRVGHCVIRRDTMLQLYRGPGYPLPRKINTGAIQDPSAAYEFAAQRGQER